MVDYDEMLRQHESVLADVDRLELLLSSPPAGLSPEHLRELTLNDTRMLHQDLARHFAAEEAGGYLRVVIEARPGLERRVGKLLENHEEILGLLATATSASDETSIEQLRASIRTALALLREHEAAETELVHQVVNQDVGTAD